MAAIGWQLDLDPRSSTFGTAYHPGSKLRVDLFQKDTQWVRAMTQIPYGATTAKGNYMGNSGFSSAPVRFIQGKLSPAARFGMDLMAGSRYDSKAGKSVPLNYNNPARLAQDLGRNFVPINVEGLYSDVTTDKNKPSPDQVAAIFLAEMVGMGLRKAEGRPNTAAQFFGEEWKRPFKKAFTENAGKKAGGTGRGRIKLLSGN